MVVNNVVWINEAQKKVLQKKKKNLYDIVLFYTVVFYKHYNLE